MKILTLVIIASVLPFMSCIQTGAKLHRTITVTATGEVEVENSVAAISMTVTTRNNDAAAATQENAEKMTAVQKALTEKGISKNYMTTSNFSLWQDSAFQNGKTIPGQYIVTNQINVTLSDTSKVGEIIDAAIEAGANEMNSLTFRPSNVETPTKDARILAIREAENKAMTLATSAGTTIKRVVSIDEITASHERYANDMVGSTMKFASTPVNPGNSVVSVTIHAVYEMK